MDRSGVVLDYVRSARRIRASGRRDCATIHASLRRLARSDQTIVISPPPCQSEWAQSPILGHRAPAARQFARAVLGKLIGDLLPWTDRQILLKQAANLGITRFDASLIIAAVQHSKIPVRPTNRDQQRMTLPTLAAPIATFLILQLTIIAAVWRLFF